MRSIFRTTLPVCLGLSALIGACRDDHPPPTPAAPTSAAPSALTSAAPPPREKRAALVREGGAIVRAPSEEALYIADEDQRAVRRMRLPVDAREPMTTIPMPGPPAAVLALYDRVLVTIRGLSKGDGPAPPMEGPGLLLVMRPDPTAGLVEVARVELPADAWGLAVTPDEKIALVTSAWTHKVSAIDIAAGKKLWTLDVPREPRGVVVMPNGKTAYVTHLLRASLSRIDSLDGEASVHSVPLPAAPIRTPPDPARLEAATLAYSAVLSPDGSRLFVPRHALGADGESAWNGQNTVDILLTADETPLAARASRWFVQTTKGFQKAMTDMPFGADDPHMTGPAPAQRILAFVQPRATVYRKKTRTLLIASEGQDTLVELDALSIDPSLGSLATYGLGDSPAAENIGGTRCGAPSGIALSEDEGTAFVFCRSSHDLAIVKLNTYDEKNPFEYQPPALISLGPDPLGDQAAAGRRLFFNASESMMSSSFACNACHPEGRDDGHVWHEDVWEYEKGKPEVKAMHAFEGKQFQEGFVKGVPRQTPMLAGRVSAFGPYGWKGESQTLRHRIILGFSLHRWLGGGGWGDGDRRIAAAEAIAEFLRKGLVPPPRENRELTAQEKQGEKLFNDQNVGCATCHLPKTEYTNRAVVGFGEWIIDKARFDPETDHWNFKTPSLLYIGGTAPYYHDGTSATLEELIERNGKRMGHTDQLSKEERGALVAFLKTL